MDHTKEPWSIRERGDDCFVTAAVEQGMAYGPEIMGDDYEGYGGAERRKADARRIVACVNACVGIPLELLEAPDTDGQALARKAWEKYSQVLEENEALRAELERERMRLAACGAAALGYFEDCLDEYKSASLDDVLRLQVELAALKSGDVVMVPREPREPTDTMLYMMCRAINTKEERIDSYKEMIAAAPGVQAGEKDNANVCGLPHGKEDK